MCSLFVTKSLDGFANLAFGENSNRFHWTGPAYKLLGKKGDGVRGTWVEAAPVR